MDGTYEDDVILGDAIGSNPPARLAPVKSRRLVHEPAHGTRNAPRKSLDRDRVVGRGLVLGHDLATPFAVTGPIDADKRRGTVSDWSRGARTEQRHKVEIARRGRADDREAEVDLVVVNEKDGHVQRYVCVALGLVLRRPDALLDDGADVPDRTVEQPGAVPSDDGEMAGLGHRGAADEESEGPLWEGHGSDGARVYVQEASEVHCRALGSEHLSDVTVDM